MNVRRFVLWSLLILAASPSLRAQKTYAITRFTTDNGLPSNGIKGLEWDDGTGFCWIATEAGVTRYNGSDFVTFSKSNTPELLSERMLCMLRTLQGRIFTADETGRIFYVIQNKLQYMGSIPIDARPSTFKLIGLLASPNLLRQSAGHPPARFGFNFMNETLIPLSGDRILLHHQDTLNNYRSGLYDYRLGLPEPRLLVPLAGSIRIFTIGSLLFGFDRSGCFFRIDSIDRPDSTHNTAAQSPVPCVDNDGHPLPALPGGKIFWENGMPHPILISHHDAWLLESRDQRLIATRICNAVPDEALLSFAVYNEQKAILVLGTDSKGIILIRENQVRPVKTTGASRHSTSIYSQIALPGNRILTSQGDILGNPGTVHSPLPIRTNFNNFVFYGPDSLLWFSHGDSIGTWSPRSGRTIFLDAGKGSITDGFAITGDTLYVANAIGIGILRDGRVNYCYTYPHRDINSNVPFAVLELQPGTLAIASCNGLFAFDTRNRRLDTLLSQPGVCVRALWKYKDYLFIGTYGKGIFIWKQGILRSVPLDRYKYLAYAHCFAPDRLGYCWISSNKGIFRTRPTDMIEAFENNDPEIYYHYYGRNDGMDITELNGGCTPCALLLNDSTLSFPSMDGLVWADPSKPLTHLPEGGIYIDDFTADARKVNTSSLIQPLLPSNTREIEFHLGFPAWVNKENIYIDYKLDPCQKDWQPLDCRNEPDLRYSNLPPGDYTFLLRKLNGFGNQNFSYARTSFRISAHWYQQPWIWGLFGCCLAALIAGIVKIRTRQLRRRQHHLQKQIAEKTLELERKNEELEKTDGIKTRLISIISHDLVTPLKFLHLAGKNLVENKSQLSEELQIETITEIMTTSKELELLSTNILNWIKYRNEDRRLIRETFQAHQLIGQLFGLLSAMARQKQLRLINQVNETVILFQYIEPVKIILYNLILNGINFTSHGFILVTSAFSQAGISLIVRDTGVGMTQDQINNVMADHFIISSTNVDRRKGHGLGYLIIKDLLRICKGSISIESRKDHGTQVTVLLPVH